jgi:pimeloyl-ACP methyl ester carboxylesterase
MHRQDFLIEGFGGKPIAITLRFSDLLKINIPVIFVHGFKGFKDWGHFPLVLQMLADNGIPVISFNFSHNGTTPEHPTDFVDLEAFGRNNYSIELEELGMVMDYLNDSPSLKEHGVISGQYILLGHSRGGGISILKAAQDSRVVGLITWASVSAFGSLFDPSIVDHWKQEGVIFTHNARTGQDMPLYYQLYEDLQNNQQRLDILKAAAQIEIAWQIVHGTEDATVPMDAALQLHAACPTSTLIIMEGANHTFGGKHPWELGVLPEHTWMITQRAIEMVKMLSPN